MAANRYRYLRGEVIMRKRIGFVSLILMFAVVSPVLAQDFCTENSIQTLEQQLSNIESRESQLRIRLEELDQELLPAHIERPLAGIGSTRPDLLRENRRKMLTIERDGLRSHLDVLEQSQASVESEIASAENAGSRSHSFTIRWEFCRFRPAYCLSIGRRVANDKIDTKHLSL